MRVINNAFGIFNIIFSFALNDSFEEFKQQTVEHTEFNLVDTIK